MIDLLWSDVAQNCFNGSAIGKVALEENRAACQMTPRLSPSANSAYAKQLEVCFRRQSFRKMASSKARYAGYQYAHVLTREKLVRSMLPHLKRIIGPIRSLDELIRRHLEALIWYGHLPAGS
jgi:hypothetical protein